MMNAKKLFSILFVGLLTQSLWAQTDTLLTIDNKPVSSGEFLRIYQKNNSSESVIDKKSMDEYLDLFINFKLKVTEAEHRGMDTSSKFTKELKGYQSQLEKPYFTDKNVDEKLIKEAFDRQQKDVRASHILIMVDKNAAAADTLAAYEKIKGIRQQIIDGKKDFRSAAIQNSQDPSAKQNGGDLGFFTVFQMVYPFESAAYNTPVGQVSEIVRTQYGYHILKVTEFRPAKGEVLVAHIMVATPKDADSTASKAAEAKINMIYGKLVAGEEFKKLAQLYSDDKGSAKNGGTLQWFGTNYMVPSFEKASFDLANKGDYSKPIKTEFGWHIIQLLDKKEPAKYEESQKSLKERISNDMRARMSKDAVYNRLKTDYNYKPNQLGLSMFYSAVDTSIFSGKWDTKAAEKKLYSLSKHKHNLFDLNGKVYTQAEFIQYLAKNTSTKRKAEDVRGFIDKMYRTYLENELQNLERENLSKKYPDYAYLLQEYHDGILLFDITDLEVWSKAINDSVGMQAFYEANKKNYMWGQRVNAQVYSAKDDKTLAKLIKVLEKKASKSYTDEQVLAMFNKGEEKNVELINSKTYSADEYAIVDEANETLKFFEAQGLKTPIIFKKELNVVLISEIIPAQPKALNEAKGQITADYQDVLEKKWIAELRSKYPVVVNQNLWSKLRQNP